MSYKLTIVGAPATGKSTALKHFALARQDTGFLYIDPTGHHTDDLLGTLPHDRVVLFDPTLNQPTPLNPLTIPDPVTTPGRVLALMKDLAKYGNASTGVFDRLVRNSVSAVLYDEHPTFIAMKLLLLSDSYRTALLPKIADPFIRSYWEEEFPSMDHRTRTDRIQSTLNQLDVIINDPRLRRSFCYPSTTVPTGPGTIFLARLPLTKLDPDMVRAVGLLLLSALDLPVLIDDAHLFHGTTLTRLLRSPRDTMVAVPDLTGDDTHALLSQTHKLIFRVSGADSDRLSKLLSIGPQSTQPNQLDDFRAYYTAPGYVSKLPFTVPPFYSHGRKFVRRYTKSKQHVDRILEQQWQSSSSSD